MDNLMKIDGVKIKVLREKRAWSQDHLATVASVSVRTIQRIEAEGVASAETRMALATALGVAPSDLLTRDCERVSPDVSIGFGGQRGPANNAKFGSRWGMGGAVMGFACSAIGIISGGGSGAELGVSFGIWGAAAGLTFATLGVASNRWNGKRI